LPQFNYSQYGTDLIVSYLENILKQQLPQDSELFVYNNDYYGQRIYFKEDRNQTYPYLIGLGRDFNMTEICWIPGYSYNWLWATNCNYAEEPESGIYIDASQIPKTVQRGVPFDICLKFYNVEGGRPADPSSFYVRIAGSPCNNFMRNATGVYYLYDYVIDKTGTQSVNISAFRGGTTSISN
jgi:hypothetical protein